jgi:protein transport protein SEC31
VEGKINQALLCGSIELAVNICLENDRWADAILLASKGSPELMEKVQNKYFQVG